MKKEMNVTTEEQALERLLKEERRISEQKAQIRTEVQKIDERLEAIEELGRDTIDTFDMAQLSSMAFDKGLEKEQLLKKKRFLTQVLNLPFTADKEYKSAALDYINSFSDEISESVDQAIANIMKAEEALEKAKAECEQVRYDANRTSSVLTQKAYNIQDSDIVSLLTNSTWSYSTDGIMNCVPSLIERAKKKLK